MQNSNIDFGNMKVSKHFNPLFQLCFKAIPLSSQEYLPNPYLSQQENHTQMRQGNKKQVYIMVNKRVDVKQSIFECKSICPIFNSHSQSYILVKGQNLWDYYKSKRSTKDVIMSEEEIFIFIQQIIQALIKLANQGIYHSHLKEYTIYRLSEYSYQLVYHPSMKSMLQLAHNKEFYWYDFYLAPQDLEYTDTDKHQKQYNQQKYGLDWRQKNVIFGFGLMLLNMVNVEEFGEFYDKNKVEVDWQVVKRKILNGKSKYSQQLLDIIQSCLNEFPQQRPSFKQVYIEITNNMKKTQIIQDKFKLKIDLLVAAKPNNSNIRKSKSKGEFQSQSKHLQKLNNALTIKKFHSSPPKKRYSNSSKQNISPSNSDQQNNNSQSSRQREKWSKQKDQKNERQESPDTNDLPLYEKSMDQTSGQRTSTVKKWSSSISYRQPIKSSSLDQNKQQSKVEQPKLNTQNNTRYQIMNQQLHSTKYKINQQTLYQQKESTQEVYQKKEETIDFERGTFGGQQHYSYPPFSHVNNNSHRNKKDQFALDRKQERRTNNVISHIKIQTECQVKEHEDLQTSKPNLTLYQKSQSSQFNTQTTAKIKEDEEVQKQKQMDSRSSQLHDSQIDFNKYPLEGQNNIGTPTLIKQVQSKITVTQNPPQNHTVFPNDTISSMSSSHQTQFPIITIEDLKLKSVHFAQTQTFIDNIKNSIATRLQSITLQLQHCLLPLQQLQKQSANPGIYIEGNLYFGAFKKGRRNGFGLQIFPENQYYYGNFQDDLFHGQGFYFWKKNEYFLGQFLNGAKTFGILNTSKINYCGEFHNSKKMNGVGKAKSKTGQIYTGQWREGKKHGVGEMIQITNDKFIGQWENGKKSGYGEYILSEYPQEGFKIKAIWHKNEIISDAIIDYSNGNQYEGPLVDLQKHGKGIYTFKKGGYFKGTFYKDNPTHGELVYRNGQKYIGSLRNMKRHGFGEYHYLDGTIKKGNWIDDVRVEKDVNY